MQRLKSQRNAVEQRTLLLAALNRGLLLPGEGHSDRLALIARSIPAPAWVTEVKADQNRFELSGFTLEPATLNTWVDKLAESPLMRGLNLATVKVEKLITTAPGAPAMWSFNLVNVQP
jgi:Tfp pilus assembly protein PilN